LIEPGPIFDLLVAGGLQTGEGDRHHGDSCGRTPVLAGHALWRQGEQLQVPLLHQLQPGGILPVTGPWHGGRSAALRLPDGAAERQWGRWQVRWLSADIEN
jgi:hypothetical protein